jgi:hypothetical protein
MKYDGSPIFAFIIDKKIVSDIGFSITHDKYGNKLLILVYWTMNFNKLIEF